MHRWRYLSLPLFPLFGICNPEPQIKRISNPFHLRSTLQMSNSLKFVLYIVVGLLFSASSAFSQSITRVEYFFDSDPGFGNGISIPITSAASITQGFTVPLGTVSQGFHALYIRAKDSNGLWSIPVIHPVYVQLSAQSASLVPLTRVEYFFDTDPGRGNGFNIPITSAINITQSFTVPLGTISEGFHALYLRAKDSNGLWSIPVIHPVFVQNNAQSAPTPALKRFEYFIDTDPGTGNATQVALSAPNITESIVINLASVPDGFHTLYLRTQDVNGRWSLPLARPFYAQQSGPGTVITALEYFFDDGTTATAPRTYSAFTPAANVDLSFNAPLNELQPSTSYDVYITAVDNSNKRSKKAKHAFITPAVICDPLNTPSASAITTCLNTGANLTATGAVGAERYAWFSVPVGGEALAVTATGAFTTPAVTANTTYYVAIINGTCESVRTAIPVTLSFSAQPTISTSFPVNGSQVTLCAGSSISLSAPTGFTGYAWSNGATTPTITVSTSGTYTVTVTDNTGCTSVPSESFEVIIQAFPCLNRPPEIEASVTAVWIEGKVSIDLNPLVSDPDDNLDISTLRVLTSQSQRGASASLTNQLLTLDYSGVLFAGSDFVDLLVCDLFRVCTQQTLQVEVGGDIEVFNAISPNGDTKNEILFIQYITTLPDAQNNRVTIYNRWGDVVWEGKNYDNTTVVFKGLNKNGNELPSGTYFYKLEFTSGRPMKTGYLALKK
ncbi:MAG: gliding motility-associated C-terminal domain-containing protein [Cyclobacteriaceae bacterium]|nr:gliding motility-associated C-terminal domain-containing protein [Cyclobacteriaceae bacterium]UYN86205.1 MAG: gliding motility-associated C-terminal domain-containing protein [Cyclobacteriaceae bacterium]